MSSGQETSWTEVSLWTFYPNTNSGVVWTWTVCAKGQWWTLCSVIRAEEIQYVRHCGDVRCRDDNQPAADRVGSDGEMLLGRPARAKYVVHVSYYSHPAIELVSFWHSHFLMFRCHFFLPKTNPVPGLWVFADTAYRFNRYKKKFSAVYTTNPVRMWYVCYHCHMTWLM